MPTSDSKIEVSQHLTPEQTSSLSKPGNTESPLEAAMANYVSSFQTPHDALEAIKSGEARREAEATTLEGKASKKPADEKRLDQLRSQLQGDQMVRGGMEGAYDRKWQEFMGNLDIKSVEEAAGDYQRLRQQLDTARSKVDSLAPGTAERVAAENARDYLNQRYIDAGRIVKPRVQEKHDTSVKNARTERENWENGQKAELEGFDVDRLSEENTTLEQKESDLSAAITTATTAGNTAEVERLNKDLDRVTWRKTEAEKIATRKLEAEAKTVSSDIDKDEETSNIRNLNSVQLINEIVDRRAKVEAIRGRIQTTSVELADPTIDDARKRELLDEIHNEKAKLGPDTEVLKLYEDAQYQSDLDFRNASSNERAETLLKIAQEGDLVFLGDYEDLKNKLLLSGEPMTKEEIASLGKQLTGRFLENGIQTWTNPDGLKLGDLRQIFAARPELQKFFSARLGEDKASRALLDEHAPNWKKLIKNPKWLLILLAIVAGLTVATVAVPAVAAIGKGAGAAKGLL